MTGEHGTSSVREEEVVAVLDQITRVSIGRGKPSLGRLATVQAMVDLGPGWHKYTEVSRRLQLYIVSGGIYVYEFVRKYPSVFEKNEANLVRINPDALNLVTKHVGKRMREVQEKANGMRKHP